MLIDDKNEDVKKSTEDNKKQEKPTRDTGYYELSRDGRIAFDVTDKIKKHIKKLK